jgi:hypothetical protein
LERNVKQSSRRVTSLCDWQEVARAVRDASGWRCVRCNGPHEPAADRHLAVLHYDGDTENDARWNLMALCAPCGRSVRAAGVPVPPLLTLPALWLMPYLAGAYEARRHPAPGPGYILRKWVELYERACGPWPEWAPTGAAGGADDGGPPAGAAGCTAWYLRRPRGRAYLTE